MWDTSHSNQLFVSLAQGGTGGGAVGANADADAGNDCELALEVWNANLVFDDLVGRASLPLPIAFALYAVQVPDGSVWYSW